jgi:hypothetical protein
MKISNNEDIVQGYDGSRHAPSSEKGSSVKKRGHKKEKEFAKRICGEVIKGTKKPDVIKGDDRYSVKGALTNIQFLLLSIKKSGSFYSSNHPVYKYQLAGYNHKKFKYDNGGLIRNSLFDEFKNSADEVVEFLSDKDNFRFVIEKVLSDGYDVNKLAVLQEVNQDALIYNMKDVVDYYVNSNYKVRVTKGAKIVVDCDDKEIFYLEIRGSEGKVGSMNHGCRAQKFYNFLKENLNYEVIPV